MTYCETLEDYELPEGCTFGKTLTTVTELKLGSDPIPAAEFHDWWESMR